jgi:hypothetical protein
MTDKPKVVVSRTRRTEAAARDFTFSLADVPALKDASLASYRTQAWEAFKRLSLPKTTEEPWRRTDLRNLPVDSFVLSKNGASKNLPPVPGICSSP